MYVSLASYLLHLTMAKEKTSVGGKDLLSYLYLPIQRLLAYEALLKVFALSRSKDLIPIRKSSS